LQSFDGAVIQALAERYLADVLGNPAVAAAALDVVAHFGDEAADRAAPLSCSGHGHGEYRH
jgi:hypothetical protein